MADPKIAFAITIDPEHEGGFQKDPDDKGDWTGGEIGSGELKGTKYGISAAQFPHLDIENLTPDDAIKIYIEGYWKKLYSQIDSQLVANKLADLGVLFGVGVAVRVLQATLKTGFPDVDIDGVFGPTTLDAVNQADESSLLQAYKSAMVARTLRIAVANPHESKFVAGWGRRINS